LPCAARRFFNFYPPLFFFLLLWRNLFKPCLRRFRQPFSAVAICLNGLRFLVLLRPRHDCSSHLRAVLFLSVFHWTFYIATHRQDRLLLPLVSLFPSPGCRPIDPHPPFPVSPEHLHATIFLPPRTVWEFRLFLSISGLTPERAASFGKSSCPSLSTLVSFQQTYLKRAPGTAFGWAKFEDDLSAFPSTHKRGMRCIRCTLPSFG